MISPVPPANLFGLMRGEVALFCIISSSCGSSPPPLSGLFGAVVVWLVSLESVLRRNEEEWEALRLCWWWPGLAGKPIKKNISVHKNYQINHIKMSYLRCPRP